MVQAAYEAHGPGKHMRALTHRCFRGMAQAECFEGPPHRLRLWRPRESDWQVFPVPCYSGGCRQLSYLGSSHSSARSPKKSALNKWLTLRWPCCVFWNTWASPSLMM